MDAQRSLFSLKSRTLGLGQTNWPDRFWGIWGIFDQTISTHFGAVSPLSMFSIIQPLFLQNTTLGLGFEFEFGFRLRVSVVRAWHHVDFRKMRSNAKSSFVFT